MTDAGMCGTLAWGDKMKKVFMFFLSVILCMGVACADLEVHFLDVGQADSILVLCDGEAMLIDGGNKGDSSMVFSYLKEQGVGHLEYIIATHAHEDHVGGLAGALNASTAGTAFCPVTKYNTKAFDNFVKYLGAQGIGITIPAPGDTFMVGGAECVVLGPLDSKADQNNLSIVIRLVYGGVSFLFVGDAERESELLMLDAGYDLASTVLKVGHHGSDTSTTYPFLREVMPQYAVISVGKGNSYGHPSEATLSKLRDADVIVYRTDHHGTIVFWSDGEFLSVTTEK